MKLTQDINNLLILEHLIASGNERHCWHHPHDERLCVKTTHNAVTARRQNELELSYQHWLTKKGIETLHLARIYGEVNTNHGKGILLEKIVWQRYGRPVSLSEAIRDGLVSRLEAIGLVEELFEWLFTHGVVVTDYNPSHFLIREDAEGNLLLTVVDGLGGRHLDIKNYLRRIFPPLSRHKIRRMRREVMTRTRGIRKS